jgi:ABC-type transporter lipoprotein component MlaA
MKLVRLLFKGLKKVIKTCFWFNKAFGLGGWIDVSQALIKLIDSVKRYQRLRADVTTC